MSREFRRDVLDPWGSSKVRAKKFVLIFHQFRESPRESLADLSAPRSQRYDCECECEF